MTVGDPDPGKSNAAVRPTVNVPSDHAIDVPLTLPPVAFHFTVAVAPEIVPDRQPRPVADPVPRSVAATTVTPARPVEPFEQSRRALKAVVTERAAVLKPGENFTFPAAWHDTSPRALNGATAADIAADAPPAPHTDPPSATTVATAATPTRRIIANALPLTCPVTPRDATPGTLRHDNHERNEVQSLQLLIDGSAP